MILCVHAAGDCRRKAQVAANTGLTYSPHTCPHKKVSQFRLIKNRSTLVKGLRIPARGRTRAGLLFYMAQDYGFPISGPVHEPTAWMGHFFSNARDNAPDERIIPTVIIGLT